VKFFEWTAILFVIAAAAVPAGVALWQAFQ
jgi:hypothetical protein